MAGVNTLAELLLPTAVRNFVRGREIGLVLVAVVIGAASGAMVAAIAEIVQWLHQLLFGLPSGVRLSGAGSVSPWRAAVPAVGGIVLAGVTFLARPLAGHLADAIEANALYGGRLSTRGSLLVTTQTILSCGFGASVGLEAGYAQIGAAFASRLGRALAARRADMRLLVACGAAGAIAGAFNAPLAGAFYGFEVVLGTYTVAALAPVAVSALVASSVAHALTTETSYLIRPGSLAAVTPADLAHVTAIAVLCAACGIALMRTVALSESLFSRWHIPTLARPVVGGVAVGGLSLLTPQVLGAGHGALTVDLVASFSPWALLSVIALKSLASAVSLGSGFRGGLFYASLLLGALTGRLYADLGWTLNPDLGLDPDLAALTGMAAFGTAVIGAPVTMTALALETTGNFPITVAALIAAAVASLIVRALFGYSFATWRFHLRGEAIRGPHDVGWLRDLAVQKLMRTEVQTLAETEALGEARRRFQLGSLKSFAVTDASGRYLGLVALDDLYMTEADPALPVSTVMRHQNRVLLPWMPVREALDTFEAAEADALVVVDHPATRRILGMLSEAHALRCYGRELERQNPDNVSTVDPLTKPSRAP